MAWFGRHRRILPWRSHPTPYRVWISEIMLQQTQVATVTPYFERFLETFPTASALAAAPLEKVLKSWEGLGYYSRARNLHRAAREIVARHEGRLPDTVASLESLPGIGPYTAAAIASIAYGHPVAAIDGNVLRVTARFQGIENEIRTPAARRRVEAVLMPAVQTENPSDFNQALMELGALVCRPGVPACDACPLAPFCVAKRENRTAELPVKAPRKSIPHYHVAVGLIWRDGDVLILRRGTDQMLGGLWEFPGGKLRERESPAEAVEREVREETGLRVKACGRIGTVRHGYSHFRITLTAFHCQLIDAAGRVDSDRPHAWVPPAEFGNYPFPKANHKIFALLRA